jgi:ABC-type multidrug transport system ATPase subunit
MVYCLSSVVMKIILENTGKQFSRNWIFRNLSLSISSPQKLAILGPNGSGKSTLLQILSGYVSPTEGKIKFSIDEKTLEPESVFQHICIATPYLELIEEFTLKEIIDLHFQFKKAVNNFSSEEIIGMAELEKSKDKVFKYFSSGMKQRAKLALAILSDVEMLLIDEPLTNLDKEGGLWYRRMTEEFLKDKLVVVCSNHHAEEYDFCEQVMNINNYK